MTSRDFCYWLQGLFELTDIDLNKANTNASLSIEQVKCIKAHLNMVFHHEIDPSHGDKKHQSELTQIHSGGTSAGPEIADYIKRLVPDGSGSGGATNC